MSEDGLVLVEHVARFYLDRDEQLCSHEIKSICEIFMHTASEEAFRTSASMYYVSDNLVDSRPFSASSPKSKRGRERQEGNSILSRIAERSQC